MGVMMYRARCVFKINAGNQLNDTFQALDLICSLRHEDSGETPSSVETRAFSGIQ